MMCRITYRLSTVSFAAGRLASWAYRVTTITVAICLLAAAGYAQCHTKADKEFEQGAYGKALQLYTSCLKKAPDTSAYLNHKIGECYLRMNHSEEALKWLLAAKSLGYEQPDMLYSLGVVYLQLGQYDEALEQLQAYKAIQPDDKRTEAKIASCRFAQANSAAHPAFTLSPVVSLNTTGSEYGLAYHKNQLIYASTGPREKVSGRSLSSRTGLGLAWLYTATISDSSFLPGIKLEGALSGKANLGVITYDKAIDRFYCTTCLNDESDCYIGILKIENNRVHEVGRLKLGKAEYGIGHPFVTADGSTLYFTSTMSGGFGGNDIWYAKRQANGEWGNPINAGSEVNTAGNEVFPYAYKAKLFFSSSRHEGYGGLDIFVSRITDKGFGKAFNLRQPFNSERDDFNLIINEDESGGLLVSNRNNEVSSDDIYQFNTYPCVIFIEGFVYDKATNEPLTNAQVVLYDRNGSAEQALVLDKDARYSAFLQQDVDYGIRATAKGYATEEKYIDKNTIACFTNVSTSNGHKTNLYLKKQAEEQLSQSAEAMAKTPLNEQVVGKELMQHSKEPLASEAPTAASWWVQVAAFRSLPYGSLNMLEERTGVKLEAITCNDGWIRICAGPFELPAQANPTIEQLKSRGVEYILKTIQPAERATQ